ncbi:MAG TPA: hypothetical protein VNQ76_15090, partial [Planctomicrobium sp.]|nr:hypothetical protein [Planctomicrobium sp.]
MTDRPVANSNSSLGMTFGLMFVVFCMSWVFPYGISYVVLYLAILLLAPFLHSVPMVWRIAFMMMALLLLSAY